MTTSTDLTEDATRPVGALVSEPASLDASGEMESGRKLGRYVLDRELGRGGMSLVYVAFDPELERQVALKLMKPVSGSRDRTEERLLREAQALARVAHPNVVHVYDVGTVDGQVYVAMELVRGQTLKDWVAETKPRWRKVLQMLDSAGRGLAAAHAAGLVHLDFKPSNVLIGEDGRVRVVDFGLARPPRGPESLQGDESGSAPISVDSLDTEHPSRKLDERLTEFGVIMGTPGYMAPESLTGGVVDASADQFAFCVAAWRSLFGELPFAGNSRALLERAITTGTLRRPPRGANVPGYVVGVLTRGLSVDARDRYPSMDALLVALSPRGHDRRRAALVGGIAIVGAIGAWQLRPRQEGIDCSTGVERIASTFDAGRRQEARTAFDGHPTGRATWDAVERRIDGWSETWAAAHRDACEAAHIRRTQSLQTLDRRTLCLDRARMRLDTVVDLLAEADGTTIEHATDVVDTLPDLARCAESRELQLLAEADDATDPALAEELERDIGRGLALGTAGHMPEARALLEQVVAKAQTVGTRRYVASARAALADILAAMGDARAALPVLDQAIFDMEAIGWDSERLELYIDQVFVQSKLLADHQRARWYAGAAEALADRLGGHEAARIRLRHTRAVAANLRGDHELALRLSRETLELRRKAGLERGANEAVVRTNAGNALYNLGRYAEALTEYQMALELNVKTLGAKHPDVAGDRENLANAYRALGRLDEAIEQYEASVALLDELGYRTGAGMGNALNNLGVAHTERDQFEEAIAVYERARVAFSEAGVQTPPVAATLINLAEAHLVLGRADEALPFAEQGLAIFEESLPPEHPYFGVTWLGLGNIYVAQRKWKEAADAYQQASPVLDRESGDPVGIGELHFGIARTLVRDAEAPLTTEAAEHVARAREAFARAAPRGAKARARLKAWVDVRTPEGAP